MASEQAARIGGRLRERREELGLTRRQLARQLDGLATDQDIYRWETGRHKPQDDTLAAMAKVLGRDYVWAIGIEPAGETPDPFAPADAEARELLAAIRAQADDLASIDAKLTQVLQALEKRPAEDDLHRLFEEYIRRLGPEVARRRIPPRRKQDLPPEAPPTAA